jgi:hypothetical protein
MSKLAAYMQLLTHDRPEHDRYYADRAQAMTQFGLSEAEQQAVLSGEPAKIRTEIVSAKQPPKPKPAILVTEPTKPKPKPPPPPKPK